MTTAEGKPASGAPNVSSQPSAWAAELAFAAATARTAGAILMDRYERLERIDYKSATDVVTEADHLSEAHIIGAIRAAFPGDAILAEESGTHAAVVSGAAGVRRTWVIDPLDGTVNYANGLPVFCVSIALTLDGWPVTGAVLDPTRDELFAATADGPATLNERVVAASRKQKLSDAVISLSLAGRSVTSRARAIRKAVRIPRNMGSAALALAYVGNGRFDAFLQETSLSPWDVAAAGLIAARAGATLTAFDGGPWYDQSRPTRTAGVVAAPPAHHARLLALANAR
ncbi:MAG TPA: inositol monophosphatase family protein [Candidatus Limnocylindrales bacterium]|nr:inositol monophosphatase family protein [Candidatus Limnocylindrales bacterium]